MQFKLAKKNEIRTNNQSGTEEPLVYISTDSSLNPLTLPFRDLVQGNVFLPAAAKASGALPA